MPPRGGLWPRRAAQNASCAVPVRSAAHTCTRQAAAGDRPLRLPEEPSPTRSAGKRNCGRAAARSGQNGWVACVCAAVLGDTELTSTPGPKGAEADPGRVGLCWPTLSRTRVARPWSGGNDSLTPTVTLQPSKAQPLRTCNSCVSQVSDPRRPCLLGKQHVLVTQCPCDLILGRTLR